MGGIEKKRRQRAAFMRPLYDATDGDELTHVSTSELANSVGIACSDLDALIQYLEGEYLIKVDWDSASRGDVYGP